MGSMLRFHTTTVAAHRLGRRFVGCELDAEMCAMANRRIVAEDAGLTLAQTDAGQLSLLGVEP